jgi:hypothetical protein
MILIQRVINGRDLTLPKHVVQRVVDLGHGEAESRRCRPIDRNVGLKAIVLLVAVDLREFRKRLHFREDLWGPGKQLVSVVVLQSELVLRSSRATANANVLHGLQI